MRIVALCAIGIAVVLATPSGASACGTVRDWVAKYDSAPSSGSGRASAIQELAGGCGGHTGRDSDRELLRILAHALDSGLDRASIGRVFGAFRCLMGARDREPYRRLRAAFPDARCPGADALARWRSVSGGGVNLRQAPARTAPRVGVLERGQVVEELAVEGEWRRIRTWAGETGYVHSSLIRPYE